MSPVSTGSSTALSVDYRYIFVDTLSNQVLAELPLVDVNFSSRLNEAGSFNGSFPIASGTSVTDVYKNTLPGKTSLYVLRNAVCVWGGIVSTRSYNATEKILDIAADEFVSYLDRRVVWKTWSTEYAAEVEIFEDPGQPGRIIGRLDLTGNDTHQEFNLVAGKSKVWITFLEDPETDEPVTDTKNKQTEEEKAKEQSSENNRNRAQLTGQFTVLGGDATYGVDTTNYKFFHFAGYYKPATKKNFVKMPIGNYPSEIVTVRFRMETDDYLNTLLTEHFADDLADLGFANEYVAPAKNIRYEIESYSRANNVATITTTDKTYLVPGQIIAIKNLPGFSTDKTTVTSINSNGRTFTVSSTGANVSANTAVTVTERVITHLQRVKDIVTINTLTNHGFAEGDIVTIEEAFTKIDIEGTYKITRIGTSAGSDPKVFQIYSPGEVIRFSKAPGAGKAKLLPIVEVITAGSMTQNSDIGLAFSTDANVITSIAYQDSVRGAELFSFKEVIDKYTTDTLGYDYRIDCSYDSATNTFSKAFKFLPIKPKSLTDAIKLLPGGVLPSTELPSLDYFSVDGRAARGISFEYPGNIESVDFQETLQEGATRVFLQGRTDVDAPPPYAAATDYDFLRGESEDGRRWPLFDKVIKKDKIYYADDLYSLAKRSIGEAQLPVATFSIKVNGTLRPEIGSYKPGDWCIINIDDPFIAQRLASYYETKGATNARNVFLRKITGINVQLSSNPALPEEVSLQLVSEPGVDVTGREADWRDEEPKPEEAL